MGGRLANLLAREQRAFLGRDRRAWDEHLTRIRAFLGEGLARADRGRPVLILGAGSGLEVPWEIAPPAAAGWDADPWSRLRTFLRHRRWPQWVFADLSGGLDDLQALATRCAHRSWGAKGARTRAQARRRFAGLLPSLVPRPSALEAWIQEHRPGTILSANVMGQFGAVAQQALSEHLGSWWEEAFPPEGLDDALEAWIARLLRAHLAILAGSGAELWLVYDRGVVHGGQELSLGPWSDPWPGQIQGLGHAELENPLAGVDVIAEMQSKGRTVHRQERWLWPLAQDQTHVVEAVAILDRAGQDLGKSRDIPEAFKRVSFKTDGNG
jgi:hypothetical protein